MRPSALRIDVCKPGLRLFPVLVLFSPVMDRNPGTIKTVPVALISCCRRVTYGKDHRRQVVLRVLFFSCYLQANRKLRGFIAALLATSPNEKACRRHDGWWFIRMKDPDVGCVISI